MGDRKKVEEVMKKNKEENQIGRKKNRRKRTS